MSRRTIFFILAFMLTLAGVLWGSVGRNFSPDSVAYLLLGRSFWTDGSYLTQAFRDLHSGFTNFGQESRSFPPAWPILVGATHRLLHTDLYSGVLLNAIIAFALLLCSARLGRKILGENGSWAGLLSTALFLGTDLAFQDELIAARSIPFALLLLMLVLLALLEDRLGWAGVLAGVAALNRFDQLPAMLLVAAWISYRSPRRFHLFLLGFGVLYFPWGLRNILVFNSPFASDNSATAISTYPGFYGLSYFESGSLPGTIFTDPLLWLTQRSRYFLLNLFFSVKTGFGIPLIALGATVSAFPRVTPALRKTLLILGVHATASLAATSLTPFHDARYFSVLHWSSFFIVALLIAQTASVQVSLHRWPYLATPLFILIAVAAHFERGKGAILDITQIPGRSIHEAIARQLRENSPPGEESRVASSAAEAFHWSTGIPSIYLPLNLNVSRQNKAFQEWKRVFRPTHIFAEKGWAKRFGVRPFKTLPIDKVHDLFVLTRDWGDQR